MCNVCDDRAREARIAMLVDQAGRSRASAERIDDAAVTAASLALALIEAATASDDPEESKYIGVSALLMLRANAEAALIHTFEQAEQARGLDFVIVEKGTMH